MAIKLKVSDTSVKLKATSADAVQFGVESGIPIYPEPYEGSYDVTPTESEQTLGTNGLMMTDDVTVEAIPGDYVGSGIGRRDSSDLTSSGATVSVPSGYYEENASKSIPSGTVVPAGGIQAIDATLTAGDNKLSLYRECINAPYVSQAGYIESGTQGTTKITLTANVNTRASSDMTASGNTVTAPAGYYGSSASKTVQSGSATTPTGGITANPSISVSSGGLITASVSKSESITPIIQEGYVTSGTAGTVTFSGSNTSQLSTQSGTTITPTESEQTAVASGKYTTGAVKVGAISSSYVGSGVTRRDSDDLTASGATVTAPAGYYESSAAKSVASGSAGTPTASKGAVSNHSISVTPSVTNTTGYITGGTKSGTAVSVSASELVSGTKSITANGTGIDVTEYAAVDVAVPSGSPTLQTKTKSYTPTESQQTEAVSYDSGYDGIDTVNITVGAISSSYVGSAIDRRDSTDLSASGATVSVPAGFYQSNASKAVSSGTEGTPTATKGTVSSHSISVTPSVTNSAGYISGGTHSGTAVTVSASELVSGTLNVTSSGTKDVTNYASASIPSGTAGTPTATKGTVSNHSVSVTPSVTNQTGFITGSTKTGTAVTVSASELVSGSETKTANGTYDVSNLASLVVNVSGGGGGIGTLLATSETGSVNTTSTQQANLNKDVSVSGINNYDLLIVEASVNSVTNGRHCATIGTIFLTASSTIGTKNGGTVCSNKMNIKVSSNGTYTSVQGTTAYGIYPYSISISNGNATIVMYRRYNSTSTGTINGTYTTRVYGVNLYDLIGG